jgi:cellulose synthase/poly-beta-1,6-N-acetylglucosamine synthase-like glycosyltransferase/peptidoglycan/xylan/chitin deacetylase (PgdA/CDA1 family)
LLSYLSVYLSVSTFSTLSRMDACETTKRHNQVFLDPSGRRKHCVDVFRLAAMLVLLGGLLAAVVGVLYAPSVQIPAEERIQSRGYADRAGLSAHARPTVPYATSLTRVLDASAALIRRYAVYDPLDSGSFESLSANAGKLDGLLPEFLTVNLGSAELRQRDADLEFRVRGLIQKQYHRPLLFPMLSAKMRAAEIGASIASPTARAELIHALSKYVQNNSDAGMAIDFTGLPESSHAALCSFLADLARVFRPQSRKIILVASLDWPSWRLQQLADLADYVLLKFDKQSVESGSTETISVGQAWFETEVAVAARRIARNKLIIGLGSFAYDARASPEARITGVQSAWNIMHEAGASLTLDVAALIPRFRYLDDGGAPHEISLLDGVTVFNQLRAGAAYKPAGFALTRLGLEDPSVWASFARQRTPINRAVRELQTLEAGYSLDARASFAELVGLKPDPVTGSRTITFDDRLGLIVHETIDRVPQRFGYLIPEIPDRRLIALTFDDGPHPVATEGILDVLRSKDVKATFFVIGRNAIQHPHILRRTYAEGHDIGNHTYSHPLLAALGSNEIYLELTSTQRVIEGILGVHTTLFRPPYQGPSPVDPPETPAIVETASTLGYLTVLGQIIPLDWLDPPAKTIHDRVVRDVLAGKGNIVILHDWGTRESTIKALPLIIDTLRAHGFAFGTIHELIGRQRNDIMPPAEWGIAAGVRRYGILSVGAFVFVLPLLFFVGSVIIAARFIFVVLFVWRHRRLERQRTNLHWWPSSIAVVIPAYNEEKVICNTVYSLLGSSRADFNIFVVDDGSTDHTAKVVRAAFADEPRVTLLQKPNGGKASAANYALAQITAEVIIFIDGDTVFDAQAIPNLVRHFSDPAVGAVAGFALVGNRVNLLTSFQAVEYMVGQCLDRRAFAYFNANGVVPGAIGAWRRSALMGVGGYATDTLAEDADATFSIIRAGWEVRFEPEARARTEAPETLQAFLKQRYRWMFGMLQVVTKHRAALASGKPRALGWLTIPNMLIFLLQFAFISPVLDSVAAYQIVMALLRSTGVFGPQLASDSVSYVQVWLLFQAADLVAMACALHIGRVSQWPRFLPIILLQRIVYLPLIYWTALKAIVGAAKGQFVGWNKLNRTGSTLTEATVSIRPA